MKYADEIAVARLQRGVSEGEAARRVFPKPVRFPKFFMCRAFALRAHHNCVPQTKGCYAGSPMAS